jgi:putative salt-induced outer membrane protein YdiY
MMKMPVRAVICVVSVPLLLAPAVNAQAQSKPVGWTTTANLSGVFAGGNSGGSSFGLKARTERNWLRTQFFLEGGGVRQDSLDVSRFAVGTPGAFSVTETSTRTKKAENYFADIGIMRRVTERLFYELGGDYKRDLFSGIEQLWTGRAGVGYFWTDRSSQDLKVGLFATYNHQKERVRDPAKKDNFAGARFNTEYTAKFGDNKQSQFQSKLNADEDLQVTDDWRLDWDNTLQVAMTRRLALQVGGKWAYRNLPALQQIPLFSSAPGAGAQTNASVNAPLKKSDVWLTVSLVLNWGPSGPSGARPTP